MITEPAIAIIGGSGLYDMDGAKKVDEHKVKTPFGYPSDLIIQCELSGKKFFFCRGMVEDIRFCLTS